MPPFEPGDRRAQFVGSLLARFPECDDQQQRCVDKGVAQRAEQLNRGRLRPMEIIEDDDYRLSSCHSSKEVGDRLEQQVALGALVDVRRRSDRETVGEMRSDAKQISAATRNMRAEQVDRRMFDQPANQPDERLHGDGGTFVTSSVEDGCSQRVVQLASERGDECRLADPRFPGDDRRAHPGHSRLRQIGCQQVQLSGPTDQCSIPSEFAVQRDCCRVWRLFQLSSKRRDHRVPVGTCIDPVPTSRHTPFDLAHLRRWFGADLLGQECPILLVGAQCIGLAAGTGQRRYQQASGPISERMSGHQPAERCHCFCPATGGDEVGAALLACRGMDLVQFGDLGHCPCFALELSERRPGPHRQRPIQPQQSTVVACERCCHVVEEAVSVHVDVEPVADGSRPQQVITEHSPQPGYRISQSARRHPQDVGQPRRTDGSAPVERQYGHQTSLACAREIDDCSQGGDQLYRTEHPDEVTHTRRLWHRPKIPKAAAHICCPGSSTKRKRCCRPMPADKRSLNTFITSDAAATVAKLAVAHNLPQSAIISAALESLVDPLVLRAMLKRVRPEGRGAARRGAAKPDRRADDDDD